jgi:hypothetical protein
MVGDAGTDNAATDDDGTVIAQIIKPEAGLRKIELDSNRFLWP